MPQRRFPLRADEFRPIAPNRGLCLATDMITENGLRVGFMYRDQPTLPSDSGWRFFSGTETDEYVNGDEAEHVEWYDVNTIANYDPEIAPWLDSPFPIALERNSLGNFVEVEMPVDPED